MTRSKTRFDWPFDQPHDVEAKIREVQTQLKIRERHIDHLNENMQALTHAMGQNNAIEHAVWEAELNAEGAADPTGIAAMEHEDEDVANSMHELQKMLAEVQHDMTETTHEVADLERQLEDLKSLLDIARHELTETQRHALSEMAIQLEQHTPFSEPLLAIASHTAGRQRAQRSSVQTATEILKLFNHAAQIAREHHDFIAGLVHEHAHELHHLIGMLPPDVQHLIAA